MSAQTGTHYDTLGVTADADEDTIRRAYRRLMREHHPDLQPPERQADARVISAEITAAYTVLSSSDRRAEYDRQLVGEPTWVEDAPFEDEWGEEAAWEHSASPEPDPTPAPADPTPPTPPPTDAETRPHRKRPSIRRPRREGDVRVIRASVGLPRMLAILAGVLAVVTLWTLFAASAPQALSTTPMKLATVAVGLVLGCVGGSFAARQPARPTRRPPRAVSLDLIALLAGAVALALLLGAPQGYTIVAAAASAAVLGGTAAYMVTRLAARQHRLDRWIDAGVLRRNNSFGTLAPGAAAAMLERDMRGVFANPAVRVFRIDSDRHPYTHGIVVGTRVALLSALIAPPGMYFWSGTSLLNLVPDRYPTELIRGLHSTVLTSTMAATSTVQAWTVIYPTTPGEITDTTTVGTLAPKVIHAALLPDALQQYFDGLDEHLVVQQSAVDALRLLDLH